MEYNPLKKEDVQKEFKEFLRAVDALPDEQKGRNAEGELVLHYAPLQEKQGDLLTKYIKHPDFFNETKINHTKKQLNDLLADGAFKNNKPIFLYKSAGDSDYYAHDQLSFALHMKEKNIDLITQLAKKIPADKVVRYSGNDEIPHDIQEQHPLRKPIVFFKAF